MRKPRITITVRKDQADIFFLTPVAPAKGTTTKTISLPPDVWDHYRRAREFYVDALKQMYSNAREVEVLEIPPVAVSR